LLLILELILKISRSSEIYIRW